MSLKDSTIRCILIDDEPHCTGALKILISESFPDIQIIGSYNNAEVGLKAIRQHKPNLLFLDIAMPLMNGFDLLSKIKNPTFEIIFTTAFDQYAIQAFKVSAVDYLLKPINKDELVDAVNRAVQGIKNEFRNADKLPQAKLSELLRRIKIGGRENSISIHTLEGIVRIPEHKIFYLQSDGNYCKIYYEDGSFLLSSKTLGEIERSLDPEIFLRIHRSHTINFNHLYKYIKEDGGYIILTNDKQLEVSRRRRDLLLRNL